jgi:hypothetical protein
MGMRMRVRRFTVAMLVPVDALMFVLVRQMHVKLRSRNPSSLLPRYVQVIFAQPKLFQLVFELMCVHAQVQHRANKHVATDTAEDIQIYRLHVSSPAANALI